MAEFVILSGIFYLLILGVGGAVALGRALLIGTLILGAWWMGLLANRMYGTPGLTARGCRVVNQLDRAVRAQMRVVLSLRGGATPAPH